MPRPLTEAALGIVVKSGWAAAVLLTGSATTPSVGDSRRLELSDPAIPDCRQPYHAGFGTARASGADLDHLVSSVRQFGSQSVTRAISQYGSAGYRVHAIGIVVGSMTAPERIANPHIRIHALEGTLFREVVEAAVEQSGVKYCVWRQRDLSGLAVTALVQEEDTIRRAVGRLGIGIDGPWRAEQKAAALAAWLVLAGSTS